MKKAALRIWVGIVMFTLSGCVAGTTFEVAKIDPATGLFKARKVLDPKNILVEEKIPVQKYKQAILLLVDGDRSKYQEFWKGSFENMGFFDNVLLVDDFERYLIQKNLATQFDDIKSMMTLNKIQKEIGDFLVAQIDYENESDVKLELKITDPGTGKIVFKAKNIYLFNEYYWTGIDYDGCLFYPVFNEVFKWIKNNSK